jgi:hypothetical protein
MVSVSPDWIGVVQKCVSYGAQLIEAGQGAALLSARSIGVRSATRREYLLNLREQSVNLCMSIEHGIEIVELDRDVVKASCRFWR